MGARFGRAKLVAVVVFSLFAGLSMASKVGGGKIGSDGLNGNTTIPGTITTTGLIDTGTAAVQGTLIVDGGTTLTAATVTQGLTVYGNIATDGGTLSFNNTTAGATLTSDITAASASGTVSAFSVQPTAVLDAADVVFAVRDSTGSILMSILKDGTFKVPLYNLTVNGSGVQQGRFASVSTNSADLVGSASDGATAVGVKLYDGNTLSTAGAKIVSIQNPLSTEKAFFDLGGALSTLPAQTTTITPASGITVPVNGFNTRAYFKVTTTFTGWSSGATTTDLTITTLPAHTALVRLIADTTIQYSGGAGTLLLTCGTAAAGTQYIVANAVDLKACTVGTTCVKGILAADIGASLTQATMIQGTEPLTGAQWTGTHPVSCRMTSSSALLNALAAGSTTFYGITEAIP